MAQRPLPPLAHTSAPHHHTSTSTPTFTCVICWNRCSLSKIAQLLPCKHVLDLLCTSILLTSPAGPQSRCCPTCRCPISFVAYNIRSLPLTTPGTGTSKTTTTTTTTTMSYSIHIPSSATPDVSPFLREDEIITEWMPEIEKQRRRELRKVRLLDDYEPPEWRLYVMGLVAREREEEEGENGEEKMVLVERAVSLRVVRRMGEGEKRVVLKWMVERSLVIRVSHVDWIVDELVAGGVEVSDSLTNRNRENLRGAREEVRKVVEEMGLKDRNNGEREWEKQCFEVDFCKYVILRDEKGLEVESNKSLALERTSAGDVKIIQSTTLTESFPIHAPPSWAHPDYESDLIHGKDIKTRLRAIRLARQEIQGVFEMFKAIPRYEVQDLEKGCSGIVDGVREEEWECEYCEVRHRNGGCRIPDVSVLKIRDGEGVRWWGDVDVNHVMFEEGEGMCVWSVSIE